MEHPDYSILAQRISISNLHKTTPDKFSECMRAALQQTHVLNPERVKWIIENAAVLDPVINHAADYKFDYFGFKILENGYLLKNSETSRIIDRPQYMFMRVAIAARYPLIPQIIDTYKLLSEQYYTHATPSLYNSCTRNEQMVSCFLLGMADSLTGICKTNADCSHISKRAFQHRPSAGIRVAKEMAHGRYTSSRGTVIFFDSCDLNYNRGLIPIGPEHFIMHCGFQIYSWSVFEMMPNGHYLAKIRRPA
jgi:ribonucleotide reductase alpha subunit